MRGRLAGAVAVAGMLLAVLAPVASAARECRDDERAFEAVVSDGFGQVRAGTSFLIAFKTDQPELVQDLVVTVAGDRYEFGSGPSRDLRVRAPLPLGRFEIWFEWKQPETPYGEEACDGELGYYAIAVPPNSTFGDPDSRVEGRWRIQLKPQSFRGKTLRTTWRMTPRCDYGGCVTGAVGTWERYRFEPDASGYEGEQRTSSFCWGRGGRRVPRGETLVVRHRFRVTRGAYVNGTLAYHAARIAGTTTATDAPTPKGRAAGCRAATRRWAFSGVFER